MRIRGLCLLKNEADIIRYSLRENLRWCDVIYVYDNESEDGTMELVEALAREEPRIVPFGRTGKPFADQLRADVFNHFRGEAQTDDWWCRLDADEVHVDDVRGVLGALPRHEQLVWSIYLQYYLTDLDLPRLEPFDGQPPFAITAENLPRYYRADYAEPKFFRHRPGLRWGGGSWPDHVGLSATPVMRHQHFQYRSPAQIERRLETRRQAASNGWTGFPNSSETSWRQKIQPAAQLHFDAGDGVYVIEKEKVPRHLEAPWRRGLKRLLHGVGVWP